MDVLRMHFTSSSAAGCAASINSYGISQPQLEANSVNTTFGSITELTGSALPAFRVLSRLKRDGYSGDLNYVVRNNTCNGNGTITFRIVDWGNPNLQQSSATYSARIVVTNGYIPPNIVVSSVFSGKQGSDNFKLY